jgi:hypothetical protein
VRYAGVDMSDRELLELAAKACGLKNTSWWEAVDNPPFPDACGVCYLVDGDPYPKWFNPLVDDGQAFQLAAKLKMLVDFSGASNEIGGKADPLAETRRAIVRAAAEIGKQS